MKQTVLFNDFVDAFQSCRPENFSYDGLTALFQWLESLEEDTGEEIELDVIAICCNFSEYDSAAELLADYDNMTLEQISESTNLINLENGGIIIETF